MNRPRLVAVASATLGSTAVFVVLSRWRLAGTITGAALVPVIFTFVSHYFTASLERMSRWARAHTARRRTHDDSGQLALFELPAEPRRVTPAAKAETPAPRTAGRALQWSVAAFALLAFATSVYSLTHTEPALHTIVREQVVQNTIVQKTVTVTAAGSSATAPADTSATTPTTLTGPGAGGTQDTVSEGSSPAASTSSTTSTTVSPIPAG